jgi:hypothetical protein
MEVLVNLPPVPRTESHESGRRTAVSTVGSGVSAGELMLELGALLGLLYVGFLACWIWATRFRRGSRGIDTRGRID